MTYFGYWETRLFYVLCKNVHKWPQKPGPSCNLQKEELKFASILVLKKSFSLNQKISSGHGYIFIHFIWWRCRVDYRVSVFIALFSLECVQIQVGVYVLIFEQEYIFWKINLLKIISVSCPRDYCLVNYLPWSMPC